MIGLYLAPPANAAVFAVDEKPQIQALERTAPVLPMIPGTPERRSHDYVRHGTIDLFAALNTATGKVIGQLSAAAPGGRLPGLPGRDRPADRPGLAIHVICDNLSAHKAPAVHKRRGPPARPAPLHAHVLLAGSARSSGGSPSRQRRCLDARRILAPSTSSTTAWRDWIKTWNADARPFKWTKTADQIIDRICRYCSRISGLGTRSPAPGG